MWHSTWAWLKNGDWKPTFDGMATLIAGVVAFGAVQWQLRRQRQTQHEDRLAESRSVATAILFEIDLVYRSMIRETAKILEDAGEREFVAKPHPLHFPVYEGNTTKLGQLPSEIVQDVVQCYGAVMRQLITVQQYSIAITKSHEKAHGEINWKGMAAEYRTHLKQSGPTLMLLVHRVSEHLCEYTQVPFEAPTIAVASENASAISDKIRKMESSPN
jgi:hypothetical protein